MSEKPIYVGPGRDSIPAIALREIGPGLYGSTWQSDLARQLTPLHPKQKNVTQQMVARWAAGGRAIPAWVWLAVDELFEDRASWITMRRLYVRALAEGFEPPEIARWPDL